MIRRFGEFELDEDLFELRHDGRMVSAEPKVFNVLVYLVRHRDRVVPKHELFAQLWPGEFVSDAALTSCIKALRKLVGDDGAIQRVIKTVHGRGYRFVAEVHGVTDPGPLDSDESPVTSQQSRTDFVGREPELQQLTAGLDDAWSGRGRLLLLVGEPGIGKTRTAEELATVARQRGALVLVGHCYEGDGAPAFWPWIQVMRAAIRDREPSALQAVMGAGVVDIAQVVPEVRQVLPAVPAPAAIASEQARFRFFDSFVTCLKRVAQQQPSLLILDDLHWADRSSLLLLEFLARELRESRLLVIGTYRDVDLGRSHPLTQTLGELARSDGCHRFALLGLAESEVGRFIVHALGSQPAALVAAVYHQTDGNPFFLNEVVRLLADEGRPQNATPGDARTWSIPQSVREAISRRLSGLSEACNLALQLAAVIGRDFTLPVLARVWESAAEPGRRVRVEKEKALPVLAALDEATNARLLEARATPTTPAGAAPAPLGRYRFSHALVRETLYEALPAVDRTRLHRIVGDVLEDMHRADLDAHVAEIAHHYFAAAAAGEVGKAMEYAARAAQRAVALFAYEEAGLHYERALQLCELSTPTDERQPCELLLGLGENQWRAGDFDRARATFQQAASAARGLRSPELLARAALGYGGEFRGFDLGVVEPTLIELLEEALQRVGSADSGVRARLLARLAVALYHVPDSLPRREELSGEAVTVATRVGDGPAQLAALYSRQWAIWGPENLEERLAAVTEMARVADQLGDRDAALHAHRFRFIDLMDLGDVTAANVELETCARLATALRQPYYLWYVTTFRALRAFLDGRFDESERLAQEALKVGQRAQSQNVAQIYGLQIFGLRREQGRLAELEPAFQNFVERYPALPSWRAGLTYLLAELGREADARAHFEVLAANDFAAVARDSFWLAAMATISDACVFLGDARRAAVLYALLAPYAQLNVMDIGVLCLGSAARCLGRLAAVLGEWDPAERHFEDALQMDLQMGGRSLIAHTQHEYAEMLLQRGRPGAATTALQHLEPALTTYEQLGMRTFHEKAATLKRHAEEVRAGRDKAANESGRARSRVAVLRLR